jgi:DNA-binding PadR family transcriptional regulator
MRHRHFHSHGHDGRRFARGDGEHRGRRGGGSRLGRFFAHGDLRLVILQLISEKPRHGYELIKAIEEKTGGVYSPSAGVIYPTLTMLEELDQVTVSAGESGKKQYAITEAGTAYLTAHKAGVEALMARLSDAEADPAPAVMEAMHRLRHAVRERLARGELDAAKLQKIVTAIDMASVLVGES